MKTRIKNSNSFYFSFLFVLSVLVTSCLDSGDSSGSDNKISGLSDYVGEWFYNGVGSNEEKTLKIYDTLRYEQHVDVYGDISKYPGDLSSNRIIEGTITHIMENENNSEFDSIFIDLDSVSITPKSSQQVTDWNTSGYGGQTDWVVNETKEFNKSFPGEMDKQVIWKSNILIAVKRDGELLEVNERAGFDGDDPEHEIYFQK